MVTFLGAWPFMAPTSPTLNFYSVFRNCVWSPQPIMTFLNVVHVNCFFQDKLHPSRLKTLNSWYRLQKFHSIISMQEKVEYCEVLFSYYKFQRWKIKVNWSAAVMCFSTVRTVSQSRLLDSVENFSIDLTVTYLMRLDANISSRRPRIDPRPLHVELVAVRVAVGYVSFVRVLRSYGQCLHARISLIHLRQLYV
jgi:hypothetical protein